MLPDCMQRGLQHTVSPQNASGCMMLCASYLIVATNLTAVCENHGFPDKQSHRSYLNNISYQPILGKRIHFPFTPNFTAQLFESHQ